MGPCPRDPAALRDCLYAVIRSAMEKQGCEVEAVGVMLDHIPAAVTAHEPSGAGVGNAPDGRELTVLPFSLMILGSCTLLLFERPLIGGQSDVLFDRRDQLPTAKGFC